jgi:hypothetical protein
MRVSTVYIVAGMTALLGLSFAYAQAPAEPAPEPQINVQKIVEQQTQLRGQVAAKRGAFKDMHESDRDRLLNRQGRLLQLLDGRRNLDELRAEERVEVFNVLQEVNGAVTKAEDERQICERTRVVGTHRYQVVCMTGKQYREHRENAKKSMRTLIKCEEGCNSN